MIQTNTLLTTDRWRLALHSILPQEIKYQQPILCIHGFSQSHLTWTSGHFAQTLAAQGIPTYLLDLRGHGGSCTSHQREPYPSDINYAWNTSAFLEHDIPTAIAWIQRRHPKQKIVLCGHSMGGILSLVTTIQQQENIAALIPLASPINGQHMGLHIRWTGQTMSALHQRIPGIQRWWRAAPMRRFFKALDLAYHHRIPRLSTLLPALVRFDKRQIWPQIWHPDFTSNAIIRETFQNSFPEAMGVVSDMIRWSQRGQIDIGSAQRVNYTPHFHNIRVPVLAAWGERDILAPPKSGDLFLQKIRSTYKQSLVLDDTRHVDIIAGKPSESVLQAIAKLYQQLP